MNKSIIFRAIAVIVLVSAIIGLGAFAYNAGLTQGFTMNAQAPAGEAIQPPPAYYPMPYLHPFYGFGGFGLLGCLAPLFLLCIICGALRFLFGHGPRGWGRMHHGHWGMPPMAGEGDPSKFVPPPFEQWHRRAHEQKTDTTAES